jgi:hypothetical protein
MKGMVRGLLVTGLLAGLVVGVNVGRVDARAKNKTVFQKQYPEVEKNNKDEMNCFICHEKGTSDRKKRNNYGEALAKNIGKNEMDEAKIKEALKKTEPEKSAIKDKTFGDLLKEGKLPASK